MDYLPIFARVDGRRCLVVGGGEVAARRIRQLLSAGARITVVAPELDAQVRAYADNASVTLVEASFEPNAIEGCFLVVAATDDREVNRAVFEAAEAAGRLVNVVDQPDLCNYITPAIVDRSPIVIAISSGGRAPVLARTLRARLETLIPTGFGLLGDLMGRLRERSRRRFPDVDDRRRFWESVVNGPIGEMAFAGRLEEAGAALEYELDRPDAGVQRRGEVALVGGGPGDPDLLTFRALRVMQQADVLVYDRLVAPAIVELARRDAERIFVGKARDVHTVPQDRINALLVERALAGQRVVRLKGGDPFMFGRGGEEIDTLAEHGIPFQVVPGITSANGCAAYAGIPLTHRDHAQSCLFVTGHLRDGAIDLDFSRLVAPRQTLCVYMGVHSVAQLSQRLIAAGLAPEVPAAVVERGTTPAQRVFVGTVASLPEVVERHKVSAPALFIIGEVVSLHDRLAWFRGTETPSDAERVVAETGAAASTAPP